MHVVHFVHVCLYTALQQQNTRLAKFQQDSYKFHLQHHANIKKIISGLNQLSENFERMGMSSFELKPDEDRELMQRCATSEMNTMTTSASVSAPGMASSSTSSQQQELLQPFKRSMYTFLFVLLCHRQQHHPTQIIDN